MATIHILSKYTVRIIMNESIYTGCFLKTNSLMQHVHILLHSRVVTNLNYENLDKGALLWNNYQEFFQAKKKTEAFTSALPLHIEINISALAAFPVQKMPIKHMWKPKNFC